MIPRCPYCGRIMKKEENGWGWYCTCGEWRKVMKILNNKWEYYIIKRD